MVGLFSRRRSSTAPPAPPAEIEETLVEKMPQDAPEPWDTAVTRARSNSRPIPPISPPVSGEPSPLHTPPITFVSPFAFSPPSPLNTPASTTVSPLSPLASLTPNTVPTPSSTMLPFDEEQETPEVRDLRARLAALEHQNACAVIERDTAIAQAAHETRRRSEAEDALQREVAGRKGEVAHHVKMALYRLENQGVNLGVGRVELNESIKAAVGSAGRHLSTTKSVHSPPTQRAPVKPKQNRVNNNKKNKADAGNTESGAKGKHSMTGSTTTSGTRPSRPRASTGPKGSSHHNRPRTLTGPILSLPSGDVPLFDPDVTRRLSREEPELGRMFAHVAPRDQRAVELETLLAQTMMAEPEVETQVLPLLGSPGFGRGDLRGDPQGRA